jgi:hypothetical protein
MTVHQEHGIFFGLRKMVSPDRTIAPGACTADLLDISFTCSTQPAKESSLQ